jgi:single-stranded-DNA-specific exonuclease
VIRYDRNSIEAEISDLLALRFGGDDFMDKTLKDLFDPYGMKDMDKAVARIKEAKENDEKIMIFGDYDVDGATSTSILMHFFKKIGIQVSYRLPHRVHD